MSPALVFTCRRSRVHGQPPADAVEVFVEALWRDLPRDRVGDRETRIRGAARVAREQTYTAIMEVGELLPARVLQLSVQRAAPGGRVDLSVEIERRPALRECERVAGVQIREQVPLRCGQRRVIEALSGHAAG